MSSALRWTPAMPQESFVLPSGLKFAVARAWFCHDGSLSDRDSFLVLDPSDKVYLRAVEETHPDRGARSGARELIEAINKHGSVKVWIE